MLTPDQELTIENKVVELLIIKDYQWEPTTTIDSLMEDFENFLGCWIKDFEWDFVVECLMPYFEEAKDALSEWAYWEKVNA